MSSIALVSDPTDPNYGDIAVVDNNISLTTGLDAIRQHLWIRFQIFLGEWFLDTEVGVPYFQYILVKNTTLVVVQEILKNVILDTPGVLSLISFDFDFTRPSRSLSLDFKALTTDGVIDFSQLVEIGA